MFLLEIFNLKKDYIFVKLGKYPFTESGGVFLPVTGRRSHCNGVALATCINTFLVGAAFERAQKRVLINIHDFNEFCNFIV